MEIEYTPEEVQQHITNCFHSWDICEELSAKESLSEKEQGSFDRNQEHIQIMLARDWFSEGCTEEQKADLEKYL
tara:strand:- start:286 stop:507 length:222 start_codon:yes stop_codon:yes gene_type:complete